ncbi:MAG TPA: hypothetical protein VEX35_12615 [Allosphingosinicella sp.]|nr:hypothetical protein [Allosphingosinicella sp.]
MRGRLLPLAVAASLLAALPADAQPVPPTRGPNNSVLGSAEQNRTPGPGWVCFIDNGVALAAGETAYIDYMGLHVAAWRVIGPRGQILIKEGNSWAEPAEPGQAVEDARGRRIRRYGTPGTFRYLIYGIAETAGPEERPSVWVEGPALTGDATDRAILDRIEPRPRPAPCRRRILYGFFFD